MYALVLDDTIQSVGHPPTAARRIDTGQWVTPPDGAWTDEQAADCGYLPVVTTPRPPDTDTTTYDKTVELVGGIPTEVWTARPWTDDELAAQNTAALQTEYEVAQANLTPDETNALLGSTAPPAGEPWRQPTGAHDAYPLEWQVTHGDKMWESTLTANVWEPGISGWREIGNDWPAWVQPAGGHDAYQIGAQVSHPDGGQRWTSNTADNVWEPGVYGWDLA